MKRTLGSLSVVVLALALAPAAAAKGPHAILSSGPQPVEAGKPWEVTLEVMETRGKPRPVLTARRGERLVAVRGSLVDSDEFMTRYRLEVVFPTEGRWRIGVADRKRRFEFPAVQVGGDRVPQDYVSFPNGSLAKREGGGGPYEAPETSVGHGEPLPPEVVEIAADEPNDGDGGGSSLWMILPAAGLALAGAGAWRLRAR
jgi:hypothetical protein